jgi:hypothetical protein
LVAPVVLAALVVPAALESASVAWAWALTTNR